MRRLLRRLLKLPSLYVLPTIIAIAIISWIGWEWGVRHAVWGGVVFVFVMFIVSIVNGIRNN